LNVPGLYEIYASAIAELPHGEYLQIKARKTIEGLPLDGQASYDQLFQEYLEKSHYKTGSLFTNLLLGTALICQGKYCQKTFELITNLGVNLGLSFQIADDLKDIRPDKQELVKDALNDLRERNTTAPYLLTLSQLTHLKSPKVKDVMQILQKKDKESGDIELVFKELKQHGAEEKTRDMIEFHYREAQKSFDLLTKDPLLRELLVKLSQPFLKI
jgi:geranylgeranyl pyrophosphate synthase